MLCAYEIETINRELDGILYLANHLAKQGLSTLIGDRMVGQYIRKTAHPVIFFDKDQNRKTNDNILDKGGVVLNLNAEGLGFLDSPPDMQNNFVQVADYVTKVCTWGDAQTKAMQELVKEENRDRFTTTGHPSFDLISPSFIPYFKDDEIIREHGEDYVLMNTSFAMFNHQMGFDNYVKMLSKMDEWKVYDSEQHLTHLKNRCAHQERVALAMIQLAREIAENAPGRHVIVRPHPGENSEFYEDKLDGIANVFVTKEGTARSWIASAGAVIHHDCTTGMEATLMGKLVLQFEPYDTIEGSATLMTKFGSRCTSSADIFKRLDDGVMPESTRDRLLEDFSPYLANIKGNAAQSVAKLAKGYATEKTWEPKPLSLLGNAKCWRKYVSKLLRAKQPGHNGRKVRYALSKFSRLHRNEVVEKLGQLRQCDPTLPEVNVKKLCLNTFLITPRN